jgi:hypothetical protein
MKDRTNNELLDYTSDDEHCENHNGLSKDASEKESRKLLTQKFKKLKHQISYLNIEYEESSEVFKHAKETFISQMFEYCSQQNVEPPFSNKPEEKEEQVQDTQHTKELYREIVKQTHPDKLQGLSEEEIESRAELYQEATNGRSCGDFNKILKVALELDIKVDNVNAELLEAIELEINKIENKVAKIKSDIMYKWYYLSPDKQLDIFKQLTGGQ